MGRPGGAVAHSRGEQLIDFGVVDLTQVLSTTMAMWPGGHPPEAWDLMPGDPSMHMRRLALDEHTGTHLDAPAHFRLGATVERIPAADLVVPLVVVDCRSAVGDDAEHVVSLAEILEHEQELGPIPPGVAVGLWTGWDRFVDQPERYFGGDPPVFPVLGADAAAYLIDQRDVRGLAIDTPGFDTIPGDAPAHRQVLGAGRWLLEGTVNLVNVPRTGATLVVGALPMGGSSGIPVRALALVPSP